MAFRYYSPTNPPKKSEIIAFDYETTRIKAGTPIPLYITIYSERHAIEYASRIDNKIHLLSIIKEQFLRLDLVGVKFIAWNANNFDSYFTASGILEDSHYIIRPYLTKGNQLRGMKVIVREDLLKDPKNQRSWEFLDGIAMLGLAGTTLAKFTETFAPDHQKMKGIINFDKEEFDPENPMHCMYAMRDSVGLYIGMTNAQSILYEEFNQPLTVTMGNACIKIFQRFLEDDVVIYPVAKSTRPEHQECLNVIRTYLVRGGYCFCVKVFEGNVWKYDLNQAYAAAMRDAKLPCGDMIHTPNGLNILSSMKPYIARCSAINYHNKIPFYAKVNIGARVRAEYCTTQISETWLTSIEIDQLRKEGWKINIFESYMWNDSFNMKRYVDTLEHKRQTCEGGPKGPKGTMFKAVGNHSYGKLLTVENTTELLMAKEQPDDFEPYFGDDLSGWVENVWCKESEDDPYRVYHQPQIGCFITAHVRMVVRRAALIRPDDWLYADTDCVIFSSDVTKYLDTHPSRYGAWKIEDENHPYRVIAKKVYQDMETGEGHAKGLNVKRLTPNDYEQWAKGIAPIQHQTHRQNFVEVMQGAEMFIDRTRRGTDINRKKQSPKTLRS